MERISSFEEYEKAFDNDFLPHLFIEFYYGDENRIFLYIGESLASTNTLFEKYGIFDKCLEMSEEIIRKAKGAELKNHSTITIGMPANNVVKKVVVEYDEDVFGVAAYAYNESVFNQNEGLFDEITIIISSKDKLKLSVIMHELQHVKEDCELRKKGSSTDKKLDKIGYKKLMVNLPKPSSTMERKLCKLVYLYTSFERNAYINSIYGELMESPKKFTTINSVFNFIKSTGFYQQYEEAFEWTNEFLEIKNEEDKIKVLDYLGKITNFYFMEYKDAKRWLNAMLYSYKRKFSTIIPKMAYEVFSEKMSKGLADSITMTNYINSKK